MDGNPKSVVDIEGPWIDSNSDSGLIKRVRKAWDKPMNELTNEELATLLRQKIAVQYILPLAKKRVEENYDDNSELYDGELKKVVMETKDS